MSFFPWITDWDNYSSQMGKKGLSYGQFIPHRYETFRQWRMPPYRLTADVLWEKHGRPYYNVHRGLVPKLCRINLAKIPAALLQVPAEYPAVVVRLDRRHEELTLNVDEPLQSGYRNLSAIPAGSFVHSIMMCDMRRTPKPDNSILFIHDYALRGGPEKQFVYTMFAVNLDTHGTVQDEIEKAISKARSESYRQLCANSIRLAITIGFLANSQSELIEYDLGKFQRDYDSTYDPERKKEVVRRAREAKRLGYNVGNDLMFAGELPVMGSGGGTGEGHAHKWSHIRSGHPHAVRHGEGHRLVKIVWFKPTRVKPKLPFKPEK